MKWDNYFSYYWELSKPQPIETWQKQQASLRLWAPEIIQQFSMASQEDLSWFVQALKHRQTKWFVFFVLENSTFVPERLFYPLVRTIIDADDPSERSFIKITVENFGQQRVIDELYRYEDYGSDLEVQGAQWAFYWIRMLFPDAKLRKPLHFWQRVRPAS